MNCTQPNCDALLLYDSILHLFGQRKKTFCTVISSHENFVLVLDSGFFYVLEMDDTVKEVQIIIENKRFQSVDASSFLGQENFFCFSGLHSKTWL